MFAILYLHTYENPAAVRGQGAQISHAPTANTIQASGKADAATAHRCSGCRSNVSVAQHIKTFVSAQPLEIGGMDAAPCRGESAAFETVPAKIPPANPATRPAP